MENRAGDFLGTRLPPPSHFPGSNSTTCCTLLYFFSGASEVENEDILLRSEQQLPPSTTAAAAATAISVRLGHRGKSHGFFLTTHTPSIRPHSLIETFSHRSKLRCLKFFLDFFSYFFKKRKVHFRKKCFPFSRENVCHFGLCV